MLQMLQCGIKCITVAHSKTSLIQNWQRRFIFVFLYIPKLDDVAKDVNNSYLQLILKADNFNSNTALAS